MKAFNICNIYTAAWCLYFLQGSLFTKGGLIGKLLILFVLLVSVYYFIISAIRTPRPAYLRALNILVILFSVYGIISILTNSVATTANGTERSGVDFLKQYYSSLLPIYAYYSFARDKLISEKWLYRWSIVFFVVAIAAYFARRNEMILEAMEMGSQQTEFTNNFAYLFVSLIPLIALVSGRKYYHWLLWAVVLVFSVSSFKRGAMLISAISFLFFLFVSYRSLSRQRNSYIVVSLLVMVAVYFAVEYLFQNSDYFLIRLAQTQEGRVSQRDILFSSAWYVFINSNAFNMLFGHGANMTASLIGNGAHNDWLELLVNFGLFTIIFFIYYWANLYKTWRTTKEENGIRTAIGLFLIVTFLQTLFSFSIGDMNFFEASVVGYCLVNRKHK